jgi:hypothetical protein
MIRRRLNSSNGNARKVAELSQFATSKKVSRIY